MALSDLIDANPWPAERPAAPVVEWGWGIDGEELLREAVDPGCSVVLEIGSLLGGSARFWLEHCPGAHVVCVDPWIDVARVEDRPFLEHVPQLAGEVVGRPDGLFEVFLASNWDHRERLTPVRGFSPERLADVAGHGVRPDVVYVDGSHTYEDVIADLSAARLLFPEATVCGDDYEWPAVGDAVEYLVACHGDRLRRSGNTFVIERIGDGGRHLARSARPTGPVERSWPVRAVEAFVGELPGRRVRRQGGRNRP
ncbi:MAG: class I SAM-dependent methyltransferase [Actinomycetota bacterium]